jgi:hypothetical protein
MAHVNLKDCMDVMEMVNFIDAHGGLHDEPL